MVEELDRTYGFGFKLLRSLGYTPGSGIGLSNAGIAQPLASGTPQEALTRSHARPGIAESEDKPRKCSKDVDPPECETCKKCIWPARIMHKSRKWCCYECDDWVPDCISCKQVTWDGYTLPPQDGGLWMCSHCWSSSEQSFQQSWSPWFEERRQKFPEIAFARSSSDKVSVGSKIRDFVWDLPSLPVSSAPVEIKEYSLCQESLRKLEWYGHIPDEPANTVDSTFLKKS